MRRIAQLAVAATILVALGILGCWMTIGGGSTNIAFAAVAKALDNLRSATYDVTTEMKNPTNEKENLHITSKALFLAPSRERNEMSMGSDKAQSRSIMIMDSQAGKGIALSAEMKMATVIDGSKIKRPAGEPSNMFEMVRRLVREGSSGRGEKVESLGKKEIDGRAAVGFRIKSNMANMTLWADPQTARPVRIDLDMPSYNNSHGVMNNFRYDMELDPSLFSLEPRAGYTVNNMQATMPVEDDLVNILRLIAQHNNGTFPPTIGMNKEYMQAVQAESKAEAEKLAKTPESQKLMEKLKAQYGKDHFAFMKAWMKEWMKISTPLMQKYMQGVEFYMILKPENDSHYAGKDVKLDTPDRPILWYRPTGADKYRVIYADLSVKEMTAGEAKKLPAAKAK